MGGDINFELAKEASIDLLLSSALLNAWDSQVLQTVDLTIVASAKTIERASGDWNATIDVGDIITLSGFTNTENNTQVQVLEIVSATVIRGVFGAEIVDEVATGTSYKRADKLSIGTVKKSFSMEKAFLDLTDKAIIYKGMMVDVFSLEINYGEIVTGTFTMAGTFYQAVAASGDFITDGRTITPAATTNSMNGSIDMPFISSELAGTFEEADFCIQSLSLEVNNNLTAQTCIGQIAPKDYSPGTSAISVSLSAYLGDENWDALALKLSQAPFAMGFMIRNVDGWYGFYMPAIQVSFPDPSSAGANQEVSLEMEGTAKIGENGESALVIYRS